MSKQPIELMFGAYRRQLLALLLLRPDEQFHVRELERRTGLSAGTIHRELRSMAEAGLLLRHQVGNQVLYRANTTCPIYTELASIMRKTIGFADILSDALSEHCSNIDLAFVFGSMASGEDNPGSDVDLLVLGDVELIDVVASMEAVAVTLCREINPVVMPAEEFTNKYEQAESFARRIATEARIFVVGSEYDFAELVQDRAAQ